MGWVHSTAHYLAGRVPLPAAVAGVPLADLQREHVAGLLANLPFPPLLLRPLSDAALKAFETAAALRLYTLGDLVYYSLARLIWTAISFFVIMAVTTGLANTLAIGVTRSLHGTPLSLLNHLAGAALGLAENLVTLVVLAGLVAPLLHLLHWPALQRFLSASQFLPVFMDWFQRWSPWKVI